MRFGTKLALIVVAVVGVALSTLSYFELSYKNYVFMSLVREERMPEQPFPLQGLVSLEMFNETVIFLTAVLLSVLLVMLAQVRKRARVDTSDRRRSVWQTLWVWFFTAVLVVAFRITSAGGFVIALLALWLASFAGAPGLFRRKTLHKALELTAAINVVVAALWFGSYLAMRLSSFTLSFHIAFWPTVALVVSEMVATVLVSIGMLDLRRVPDSVPQER